MWLLIMSIMYNTPNGTMVKYETVDQFKSENACLSFKNIQEGHLKKIKSQTNIKSWDMACYKGE